MDVNCILLQQDQYNVHPIPIQINWIYNETEATKIWYI